MRVQQNYVDDRELALRKEHYSESTSRAWKIDHLFYVNICSCESVGLNRVSITTDMFTVAFKVFFNLVPVDSYCQ